MNHKYQNMLAISLIQKCLQTQDPYLNLSGCGLTDELVALGTPIDILLRQCTHLTILVFANKRVEENRLVHIYEQFKGKNNFFTLPPPSVIMLKELSVLSFGDEFNKMKGGIKDMSFISKFVKIKIF